MFVVNPRDKNPVLAHKKSFVFSAALNPYKTYGSVIVLLSRGLVY